MTIRWHTVNKTSASVPSPLLPGLTHYFEQLASPHSRSHRPLHFEIDLDCVTTNSRAKYLGQNSFSSKVTVWTQVTQHSDCSTWPLKWSATLLYSTRYHRVCDADARPVETSGLRLPSRPISTASALADPHFPPH